MKKLTTFFLILMLMLVGALAVSCDDPDVDPDEAMPHYATHHQMHPR